MRVNIAEYETLRNRQFSCRGMDYDYALRKMPAMERTGLKVARKRAKITQAVVAERMGVSTPQVSRWESGTDGIPSQRLQTLTAAYEASLEELLGDEAAAVRDAPIPNGIIQPFEGASIERMRQDIPILGTALGADRVSDEVSIEQTYLYDQEIIGHAKRPVILDGRADVYGIYVQGSSMDPVFDDGAIILVETSRPPRIGDNVIVYLRKNGADQESDDGESARTVLVKRLVKRSGTFVELEQHNPKLSFRLTADEVLKMHRVLTLADLLS